MICLAFAAQVLWLLGYPDQALERSREAVDLSQNLSHPLSLALALSLAAEVRLCRGEQSAAQEQAEAAIMFSTEHGIPFYSVNASIQKGGALITQGQEEEGIEQIRQGLASLQAMGTMLWQPYRLTQLAEAYGKAGHAEEGLATLAEALEVVDKNGERFYEAELYRLKGQLTLQQFQVSSSRFQVQESPKSEVRSPKSEAEECFLKAIEIARRQQAKSLELRAAMSLARLWQQQGKREEAHQMLAEIYGWFTEGFDTQDLKDAKALLEQLS